MATSDSYLTPQQLSSVVYGAHEYWVNRKKSPHRQDKSNRPFGKWITGKRKTRPFIGGRFHYNTQSEGEGDLQEAYGRERLTFTEEFGGDEMVYDGVKVWNGLEILHDELRDLGHIVKNASSWTRVPKLSDAVKEELVNILQEKFDRREDRINQLYDSYLHRNGTGTVSIAGLDSLFPLVNTAGSIGGVSRLANPEYRHVVTGALTVASGGTLRAGLDDALRQANQYAVTGQVDVAFCGSAFLNGVKAYVEANNLNINSNVGGIGMIDPSIPDSALKWNGISLVWDPTLDILGTQLGDASLAKRAYFLNSSTIELATDMWMDFSRPNDEFDLMVSRFGWMSRMAMWTTQPNANMVARVA